MTEWEIFCMRQKQLRQARIIGWFIIGTVLGALVYVGIQLLT